MPHVVPQRFTGFSGTVARSLSIFACAFAFASVTHAQVSPEESAKRLKPAEGLEATLWAAEPLVVNPTNMDVDSRGRVWITEGLNYRPSHNKGLPPKNDADRIKILEDTDGDGKADKMTVFADKIFPVPMGIAVEEHYAKDGKYIGCKVYVGNSPDVLVFEDTDGDDKADKRYPLLSGFGGIDSDHGVHGMVLALDGKLYFTHGDGCCSVQVDHSERSQNFNVLDKSDRRVSSSNLANTLRVNRDGTSFEILADRQRNNYETCLNSFGNNFSSDNDDDGNRGCRVIWVMDGGHYGYRTPGSPRHWGEEMPGNIPKIVGTGNGSPCGLMLYEGTLLPKEFQGSIFEAEAGTRQINHIQLERHGASFRTTLGVLLGSDDPWFRPVDATAAPDGSVFVADWYDAGVGGHSFRDQTTGRIFRVAPKGSKTTKITYDYASIDGLINALRSPVVAAQDAARRCLIARGEEALGALDALFAKGSQVERARALWVLYAIQGNKPAINALGNEDPRIREQAVRMLGRDISHNGDVQSKPEAAKNPWPNPRGMNHLSELSPLAADPDAGVRRELILSLRDVPTVTAGALLKKLAAEWDGKDRWYLEALGEALERRESPFIKELFDGTLYGDHGLPAAGKTTGLALPPYFPADRNEAYIAIGTEDQPASSLSKTLGLMWRLHDPEVLPLLSKILPSLESADLRQAADDVISQIADPAGAKVLAALAKQTEDSIRKRELLTTLARKLGHDWREAKGDEAIIAIVQSALADPATLREGIALASGQRRYLNELSAFSKNAKLNSDLRVAAVNAIGSIHTPEARELLIEFINQAKTQKASSPESIEALDGVASFGDAKPLLMDVLRSDAYPLGLRREAVRQFAEQRDDANELIEMARDGKLAAELKTEATVALNAHPDRAIREEAAKVLPLEKTAGRKLPPLEQLFRGRGDASRGKQVFQQAKGTSAACASCHRVQGEGRWIGPDLSTIGTKYGKDELLRSILNPSAAIGDNFHALIIATKDGKTYSGLLVEESNDRIVLKAADGKLTPINTSDIEEKTYSETSLMPEGLAQALSDRDIVDLLEYLSGLKQPVSIVGRYHVLGPLSEIGAIPKIDTKGGFKANLKVTGADGKQTTWRTLDANSEGILDVTPLTGENEHNELGIYLAVPIVSPAAQHARLVLELPKDAMVFINGKKVADKTKPDEPLGVETDLASGNNLLLIRLQGGPAKVVATFVCTKPLEFR